MVVKDAHIKLGRTASRRTRRHRFTCGHRGDQCLRQSISVGPDLARTETRAPDGLDFLRERIALDRVDLAEAALHGVVVRRLSEQRAERAQDRHHGGARGLHGGPEAADRKPGGDRDRRADQQRGHHTRRDRVHVVKRQRGPEHIVRAERRRPQKQAGHVAHLVAADHAALGRAGGAGRVDQGVERCGVGQLGHGRGIKPPVLVQVFDGKADRRTGVQRSANQHALDVAEQVGDLEQARRIDRVTHDDLGPRVHHLMTQEIALERGVQRHAHSTQLVERDPQHHRVEVVVEQGGDRGACLHPQCPQRMGHAVGERIEFGIGGCFPAEIEQYFVRVRGHGARQGRDRGVAMPRGPPRCVVNGCVHSIHLAARCSKLTALL